MTTSLFDRAVLASLHVGTWSGRMHDPSVTEEVSTYHKADSKDAGSYSKRLVAKHYQKHVGQVVSKARAIHNTLTLPWSNDGTRILSAVGYQNYTGLMRLQRMSFEEAVDGFTQMLPSIVDEAKLRLGTMFNADEFPDANDLKDKFFFDVEINKVPEAGDFRVELGDATVKALIKDIERRATDRVEMAMKDVYQRIYDVTSKMAEKLQEFKPKTDDNKAENTFRDSLVYNVHELAQNLDSLNINDDKNLHVLKQKLMAELVEHSPEVLRADSHARSETQRKAEAIAKKVAVFLA